MIVTRQEVMYYSALLAGFFTLVAGFLIDVGMKFTGGACAIIAGVSLCALFVAYLHTSENRYGS